MGWGRGSVHQDWGGFVQLFFPSRERLLAGTREV